MNSIINPTPEQAKLKWRGIRTNSKKRMEDRPRTIKNRLGQLSMTLPRIDDEKRWAGFPGLAGWAKSIAKLIPTCLIYVEPFAGSAKVYQELRKRPNLASIYVLNDKSNFVNIWLKENFSKNNDTRIRKQDFTKCIKFWDSKDTVFLIDDPWSKSFYLQDFSCFDRESVKHYDEEVLRICSKIKGKFIITSRKENSRFRKSGYNHKLIRSVYSLSGHYPELLITTNIDLRRKR